MQSPHRARYEADVADRAARLRSLLAREAKRAGRFEELSQDDRERFQRYQTLVARLDAIKRDLLVCRRIEPVVLARYAAYQRLGYESPVPKPVDRHAELTEEYRRLRAEHKALKQECGGSRPLERYLDYCRRIESDRRKIESDGEILRLMREILEQQEAVEALRKDCSWMAQP